MNVLVDAAVVAATAAKGDSFRETVFRCHLNIQMLYLLLIVGDCRRGNQYIVLVDPPHQILLNGCWFVAAMEANERRGV